MKVEAEAFTSSSYDDYGYFVELLAPVSVASGTVSPATAKAWLADQRDRGQRARFFMVMTYFLPSAPTPAAAAARPSSPPRNPKAAPLCRRPLSCGALSAASRHLRQISAFSDRRQQQTHRQTLCLLRQVLLVRGIETMPRIEQGDSRIDYRHVIDSLVKKPSALARYRYREEMFPILVFRRTYDQLRTIYGERADAHYLRILHLCKRVGESQVEAVLAALLEKKEAPDYARIMTAVVPSVPSLPEVLIPPPSLPSYDALLGGAP